MPICFSGEILVPIFFSQMKAKLFVVDLNCKSNTVNLSFIYLVGADCDIDYTTANDEMNETDGNKFAFKSVHVL